jgi:hypothetical protein
LYAPFEYLAENQKMNTVWQEACNKYNVKPAIATGWWNKIDKKYSEEHRFYHNQSQMLVEKAEFLHSDVSSTIVFATIFQYFEFDVKKNCIEANCKAFKEFIIEAELVDDVSTNEGEKKNCSYD